MKNNKTYRKNLICLLVLVLSFFSQNLLQASEQNEHVEKMNMEEVDKYLEVTEQQSLNRDIELIRKGSINELMEDQYMAAHSNDLSQVQKTSLAAAHTVVDHNSMQRMLGL